MKILLGLLIALLIINSLAGNAQAKEIIVNEPLEEFVFDERLTDYVSSFSQGRIDHSGLRSLIEPLSVKEVAVKLTENLTNDLAKARVIHNFVRTNINYSIRLESINAEKVLNEGFGDCSEMAVLAQSLLEAAGLRSYITNGRSHMYVISLVDDYWVIVDPTQDFNLQDKWHSIMPQEQAYLVNSTATLLSYSTTSASA